MNTGILLMGSTIENVLRFIFTLFIFVVVLGLTYYVTRWIAKYQQGITPKSNIHIMDTCKISPSKYVQILKVGETYLVIGVSKDNITMLAQLEESQLGDISLYKDVKEESFSSILEKVKTLHKKK